MPDGSKGIHPVFLWGQGIYAQGGNGCTQVEAGRVCDFVLETFGDLSTRPIGHLGKDRADARIIFKCPPGSPSAFGPTERSPQARGSRYDPSRAEVAPAIWHQPFGTGSRVDQGSDEASG
jgi:hypothetical protein